MSESGLQGVADTLYIPLTARVYVSKRFPEYFYDSKALELESAIPGRAIQEGSSEYTMIASVARYHNLDEMVLKYAAAHPACNIVNLGCGLETAFWRLRDKLPGAFFYAMDLPEVIETRERVLGRPDREVLIMGDLFDLAWADAIADPSLPTLLIVSGVFQYFHNEDVLAFITAAKERFADAELIFDATNSTGLKYTNKYVKKTGNTSAMMYCAVDDPVAFACEADCELVESRPFFTVARRMLRGKVGLYTKVAMAVTDKTGRAILVHLRLKKKAE